MSVLPLHVSDHLEAANSSADIPVKWSTHLQPTDIQIIKTHLQIGQHAQQTPQQAAVYCFPVSLPLDEQENPINGFTLDLQIADDVEPEELQTHVPAVHSSQFNSHFHLRTFGKQSTTAITHQIDGSIEFCKT